MKPETLHDLVYKRSFNAKTNPGWQSNVAMRQALEGAKRFVATEAMARFMADLANESFIRAGPSPLAVRIADSLRVQARPPHESVWIEYPLRAYQARSAELRGTVADNTPELQPESEGWLIQQHPKLGPSAVIMHMFTASSLKQEDGNDAWTFPFAFAWCCDDSPLPWRNVFKAFTGRPEDAPYAEPSSYLVGISGYRCDSVSCVRSPLIEDPEAKLAPAYTELLREWMGVVRRVWALLATIDNLPLSYGQVRQAKGFLSRGRIRKFLDHQTITLNIPAKQDTRVIARKAIAAAHRKRHEVRGHWRDDWRNPPSKRCDPHLWEAVDAEANLIACALCHGRQIYIHKHERGDASLGYVTHDYKLKHEEAKRA